MIDVGLMFGSQVDAFDGDSNRRGKGDIINQQCLYKLKPENTWELGSPKTSSTLEDNAKLANP